MREEVLSKPKGSLESMARNIRRLVVQMIYEAGSGHVGGSLSAVDILTALYFHHMKHDPAIPKWPDRDRFILSKGHAAPALYAVLAESGYFPKEELMRLRQIGGILQGHPNMNKTPGVEASTGSLGQGLSIANGIALGAALTGKAIRVYVLIGDGELDEGQIWEAAMLANHYKLDKVTAIIDYNKLQVDGPVDQIMTLEPLADKWTAFGWNVIEINGHDMGAILDGLERTDQLVGGPSIIIANTIKGKGVSFMEHSVQWHAKAIGEDEFELAMKELS
ncbi:MAG: transketolase [Armatimonadetes bacterium]|nr:transketolase [Armatimonadota bacterium]